MNNKSERHHYIPEFLIKKFKDPKDNLLYVFDKKKLIIKKKSPKSIFFEWNRNTLNYNGEGLQNLENLYADIDNLLAIHLNNILDTLTMSGREQTFLILLKNLLMWRIPLNDKEFYKVKDRMSFEDFGLIVKSKRDQMAIGKTILVQMEGSELVGEMKRVLLAIKPLMNEKKLKELHKGCFIISNHRFPSLIGDCGLIHSSVPTMEGSENFIFPLSSTETFIHKKGSNCQITDELFYFQRNVAILHLSDRYVGCSNKQTLEDAIKLYSEIKSRNRIDLIMDTVFTNIN